jgi:hypothetical protein
MMAMVVMIGTFDAACQPGGAISSDALLPRTKRYFFSLIERPPG